MNEFKGTKEEIKVTEVMQGIAKGIYLSGQNQKHFLAQIITHDRPHEENLANAILFSKSPEMLEMLKTIYDAVDWSSYNWNSNEGRALENKIELLIKQATELP